MHNIQQQQRHQKRRTRVEGGVEKVESVDNGHCVGPQLAENVVDSALHIGDVLRGEEAGPLLPLDDLCARKQLAQPLHNSLDLHVSDIVHCSNKVREESEVAVRARSLSQLHRAPLPGRVCTGLLRDTLQEGRNTHVAEVNGSKQANTQSTLGTEARTRNTQANMSTRLN